MHQNLEGIRKPPSCNRGLYRDAIDARRNRRRLDRRYRHSKSDQDRIRYRSACHATNKLFKRSRRDYSDKRFNESAGDSRKRWHIANKLYCASGTIESIMTNSAKRDSAKRGEPYGWPPFHFSSKHCELQLLRCCAYCLTVYT